MPERILVDTGPLVAILARRDQYHAICVEQLRSLRTPLLTCWPVLTEAAWLLRREPSAVRRLLEGIDAGLFSPLTLDQAAPAWIARLLDRYRKLRPQLADAALVYLAEREDITTVFTLDIRDFSVYRVGRDRPFRLLPRDA